MLRLEVFRKIRTAPPGDGGAAGTALKKRDVRRLARHAYSVNSSKHAPRKVLLCELTERTSARGNVYLSGWLGRAAVVDFVRTNEHGRRVWQVFVQESAPKREGGR
jgi:hypothetical protein